MRIKTRIVLGYGYLVALLLAAALGASVGFFRLSAELSEAIANGLVGVGPEIGLLRSLGEQHDILVSAISGGDGNPQAFAQARSEFQRLVANLDSSTGATKRKAFDKVKAADSDFQTACGSFFDDENRSATYRTKVFPAYSSLRGAIVALVDLGEEQLLETEVRLRTEARRKALGHVVIVFVALLSLAFISKALQRTVLDRLDDLNNLVQAIERGDLHRRASVEYRDELGLVAERINALLDEWQEAGRRAKGESVMQNRFLVGLVNAWPRPVAVTRLDGRLVASTFAVNEEPAIEAAVQSEGASNDEWKVQALVTDNKRRVGWLVSRQSDDSEPTSAASQQTVDQGD